MKWSILLSLLFTSSLVMANTEAEPSLEEKLQDLSLPSNTAQVPISEDKLYVIQERYRPLSNAHEISVWGGKNFTAPGHLESTQAGATYRFHINDKWALWGSYTQGTNKLSDSGEKLLQMEKLVPNTDYYKSSWELGAEYNLFYGKFRLGTKQVFYFDQYWMVGAGQTQLRYGNSTTAVVDAGLAFWLGKWGSLRAGLKNSFYNETKADGKDLNHSLIGYLSFGVLLGGNS